MSLSRISARASYTLLFGVFFAVGARAQLAPPFLEYGAKFTCGIESATASDDVVAGIYATSINIHNPQARLTVAFLKKIVVARREGTGFVQPVILKGVLGPDEADRVDCPFIEAALKSTTPYVEGFIVLEVAPSAAGVQPLLDVVGKYTARPMTGAVSTQSVVLVPGKPIAE